MPQPQPQDPQKLAQLLVEQAHVIAGQADVIEQKSVVIAEQKQRIALLEEYLRLDKQRRFGASSEKNTQQSELFNEAELAACEPPADEADPGDESDPTPEPVRTTPPGRKPLSKRLPRVQVHIDLSDKDKAGALDTFYVLAREELDIVPAQVRVIEYLQQKAVFAKGETRQIKAATLPRHPIPKSLASVDLLAFVIVSKYMDGLPLYRLVSILMLTCAKC